MPSSKAWSARRAASPRKVVLNIKLVIEHIGMEQAESSTAAARKALHANTNGASPDYELPWFVILPKTHSFALTNIGSKSTALSS